MRDGLTPSFARMLQRAGFEAPCALRFLRKSSTRRGACAARPRTQITPSSRQTGAGPLAAARISCGTPRKRHRRARRQRHRPRHLGELARDPVLFAAREIQRMRPGRAASGAVTLTSPVAGLTLTIMRRARGIEPHAHFQQPAIDLQQFMTDGTAFYETTPQVCLWRADQRYL